MNMVVSFSYGALQIDANIETAEELEAALTMIKKTCKELVGAEPGVPQK